MEERDEDERQLGVRFPELANIVVMHREQPVLIARIQRHAYAFGERNHAVAELGVIDGIVQFFAVRQSLNGFARKNVQPPKDVADHILMAHNLVVAVEDVSRGKIEAKEITLASRQR